VGTGDRKSQTKGMFDSWEVDRRKCSGAHGIRFSDIFSSKRLKNTFRIVHILFMQFTELEVEHTPSGFGKINKPEKENTIGLTLSKTKT